MLRTDFSVAVLTRDEEERERVRAVIEEYADRGIIVSSWATGIGAVLIDKYDALQRIRRMTGSEGPVIAVGDSENDIPMFRFAAENGGHSALVANSTLDYPVDFRARLPYSLGVVEVLEHYRHAL